MPDLAPVRYGRMLTSAFAYYCGAATPMAWDLGHMATPDLRLAASFAVAARDNGLKEGAGCAATRRCASSYRTEMARFAPMRFLNVRHSRIDVDQVTRYCDQGANPRPRLTGPLLPAEGAQRRVEDP